MSKGSILIVSEGNKATIKMTGRVNDWSAESFQMQVDDLIARDIKEVVVFIDSIGGDVVAANRIALILDTLPSQPDCEIGAICASAATRISLKCKNRSMASNGLYMIHKPSLSMTGNEDEVASNAKLIKSITQDYRQAYAKAMGVSEDEVEKLWKVDYWMDAKEAKKRGFVTSISKAPVAMSARIAAEAKDHNCPADLLAKINQSNKKHINHMKISLLAAALGSVIPAVLNLGDSASETEVAAAITKVISSKDEEIVKLKEQIQANSDQQIKSLVEASIKDGRITATEKPKWESMLKADYATASELIAGLSPTVDINKVIQPGASASADDEGRKSWDFRKWELEDSKGLLAMKAESPEKFDKLQEAYYS